MRVLSFTFETMLEFSEPVSEHDFVLRCLPATTQTQTVLSADLMTDPRTSIAAQTDGFGNELRVGRLTAAHDRFDFFVNGLVMVNQEAEFTEPAHPVFLLPSEFARADADMAAFADEALSGYDAGDAWKRACLLNHAVFERFAYTPGATTTETTAAQAFALEAGVCQDYAHTLIALCRAQGIPARYVNGLLEGEGATHAWVQVHDGTRWRGLDPTHDRPVDDSYLRFCVGRDFSDCPIERGVFRGKAEQTQQVLASVGLDERALGGRIPIAGSASEEMMGGRSNEGSGSGKEQ